MFGGYVYYTLLWCIIKKIEIMKAQDKITVDFGYEVITGIISLIHVKGMIVTVLFDTDYGTKRFCSPRQILTINGNNFNVI